MHSTKEMTTTETSEIERLKYLCSWISGPWFWVQLHLFFSKWMWIRWEKKQSQWVQAATPYSKCIYNKNKCPWMECNPITQNHALFFFFAACIDCSDITNYCIHLMQRQTPNINLKARSESNPIHVSNFWIIQRLANKEWCLWGLGFWVFTSTTNGTDANMHRSLVTRAH